LTRVRPVSGPLTGAYIDIVQEIWRDVGRRSDLFRKIDNMLERIQRERGSGDEFLDFKTGAGGMIEAEFLVQALQMRSGIWNANWERALTTLGEQHVVSDDDAKRAASSYDLLRRCELTLRRSEAKNISTLPAHGDDQEKLARRLGYKNTSDFVREYQVARETIHALYQRYIKTKAN